MTKSVLDQDAIAGAGSKMSPKYQPPLDANSAIAPDLAEAIRERDECYQIVEMVQAATPVVPGARYDSDHVEWRRRAKVTHRLALARYRVLKDHVKREERQLWEADNSTRTAVIVAAMNCVDAAGESNAAEFAAAFDQLGDAVAAYREFRADRPHKAA